MNLDIEQIETLMHARELRTLFEHPTTLSTTFEWMTHGTYGDMSTMCVIFFGKGNPPKAARQHHLAEYQKQLDIKGFMKPPVDYDWFTTSIPMLRIGEALGNVGIGVIEYIKSQQYS